MITSLSSLENDLKELKELIELTEEENINEEDYQDEINKLENMIEEIEDEAQEGTDEGVEVDVEEEYEPDENEGEGRSSGKSQQVDERETFIQEESSWGGEHAYEANPGHEDHPEMVSADQEDDQPRKSRYSQGLYEHLFTYKNLGTFLNQRTPNQFLTHRNIDRNEHYMLYK